jgi:hypothetical protein
MLTSEHIQKFQILYERRFGRQISEEKAYELGTRLIELVRLTQRDPSVENKKCNERRNHENTNNPNTL